MEVSILNAKRAAERKLQVAFPSVATAYENVDFEPTEALHFETQFLINPVTDPAFDAGYHREDVQFQVFISDRLGIGTANSLSYAHQIREAFKKGTTMIEAGTRIHVLSTPQISSCVKVSSRLVTVVLVPLTLEVYS